MCVVLLIEVVLSLDGLDLGQESALFAVRRQGHGDNLGRVPSSGYALAGVVAAVAGYGPQDVIPGRHLHTCDVPRFNCTFLFSIDLPFAGEVAVDDQREGALSSAGWGCLGFGCRGLPAKPVCGKTIPLSDPRKAEIKL